VLRICEEKKIHQTQIKEVYTTLELITIHWFQKSYNLIRFFDVFLQVNLNDKHLNLNFHEEVHSHGIMKVLIPRLTLFVAYLWARAM